MDWTSGIGFLKTQNIFTVKPLYEVLSGRLYSPTFLVFSQVLLNRKKIASFGLKLQLRIALLDVYYVEGRC